MLYPSIKQFDISNWPSLAAQLIQDMVSSCLRAKGRSTVMLTGGRSAERLYAAWAMLPAFRQMAGVRFYFGDERCVPPSHPESNFGMALRTLFNPHLPAGCEVFRMEADDPDCDAAAERYDKLLPDQVDVLLLGVGADGHIASLFPGGESLHEVDRRVVFAASPVPPYNRITICPDVITRARAVFVLAPGDVKADVLSKAMQDPANIHALPARLALNATWLLDAALP